MAVASCSCGVRFRTNDEPTQEMLKCPRCGQSATVESEKKISSHDNRLDKEQQMSRSVHGSSQKRDAYGYKRKMSRAVLRRSSNIGLIIGISFGSIIIAVLILVLLSKNVASDADLERKLAEWANIPEEKKIVITVFAESLKSYTSKIIETNTMDIAHWTQKDRNDWPRDLFTSNLKEIKNHMKLFEERALPLIDKYKWVEHLTTDFLSKSKHEEPGRKLQSIWLFMWPRRSQLDTMKDLERRLEKCLTQ